MLIISTSAGVVGSTNELDEACEKLEKEPKCCSTATDSLVDSILDRVTGSARKDVCCEDI